jgi:hypothetical protein
MFSLRILPNQAADLAESSNVAALNGRALFNRAFIFVELLFKDSTR